MGINIIKGVGALFLVFVICFIINIQLAVASGHSSPPNMAVVFAWIGTAPAMFYNGTGFWRRLVASLLGSIASLVVPFGLGILNALLLQNAMFDYLPVALLGIAGYMAILNLAQLAIAYLVARTIVRRGLGRSKTPSPAAA